MTDIYRNNAVSEISGALLDNDDAAVITQGALGEALAAGERMPVVIHYQRNNDNDAWITADGVPDSIKGLLSEYEHAFVTDITGNTITLERTDRKSWLVNPSPVNTAQEQTPEPSERFLRIVIRCVVGAENLKILSGVMSQDIIPDGNHNIGSAMDKVANVFASNLRGDRVIVGDGPSTATLSASGNAPVQLTLPAQSGTLSIGGSSGGAAGGTSDGVISPALVQKPLNSNISNDNIKLAHVVSRETGGNTIIAVANFEIARAMFSSVISLGRNNGTKNLMNSGGFLNQGVQSPVVTRVGGTVDSAVLIEFPTIAKTTAEWNTFFASVSSSDNSYFSLVLAGNVVGVSGGFRDLYINGYKQPFIIQSSRAPTVNDDALKGINVGTRWQRNSRSQEWICADARNGAAVWRRVRGHGAVKLGSGSIAGLRVGSQIVNLSENMNNFGFLSFTAGSNHTSEHCPVSVFKTSDFTVFLGTLISLFRLSDTSITLTKLQGPTLNVSVSIWGSGSP